MNRTLRVIASVFSPSLRDAATCSSCGDSFSCGASLSGCWCSEVKLSAEARSQLSSQFSGCLCRACLEKYSGVVTSAQVNTENG